MSTHQPTEPLAPVDQQPVLGLHGEPCATCGAPLAADQRYCLACGARRADARLPFRDILAAPGERLAPVASADSSAPAGNAGRNGTLAALAGLGVVLLALGMGVLIGQAGKSDQSAQTTPQVINLGGQASTGGAPAAAATTGAATGAATSSKSGGAAKKSSGSSGGGSSAPSKAKNTQLKKLDNLSPQQYQKQSQKLPKTVGTGGAPPPKDNKPAAGGGDFQTIG